MPRNKGITVAFLRGGKARKAVHLAQMGEALPAAGQQLVGIALVTDIEQNFILRQSQRTVQSHRKFHHAQVGRKVPAGRGNTFNQKIADILTQKRKFLLRQFFYIPVFLDFIQIRIFHDHIPRLLCFYTIGIKRPTAMPKMAPVRTWMGV